MVNNLIYFRRKRKIYIEPQNFSQVTYGHIGALQKNLESLGFILTAELIQVLMTFPLSELSIFANQTVAILKKQLGSHVAYHPMYPNFPAQVMDTSEAELYINAIIHYMTSGSVFPDYQTTEREKLPKIKEKNKISLGNEEEYIEIIQSLILSKSSISETDREDIKEVLLREKN